MKAGKDIDGFWTLIESSLWCAVPTGVQTVRTVLTCPSISSVFSHVSWVIPLILATARKNSALVRTRNFCRERTLERLRMGAKRKDLFYYLVSSHIEFLAPSHRMRRQSREELPESERPSQDQFAQNGQLAIVAGSDTTSSVLTAALYYLLCNPVAYERLQAEVDGAFPSGEEPLDVTKLGQMEWLNGCMWVCGPLE
jgi:cytochrome P450